MEKQNKKVWIDQKGDLHYDSYVTIGNKKFLRAGLPTNHEEYLFNYLKKEGIDIDKYFEQVPIKIHTSTFLFKKRSYSQTEVKNIIQQVINAYESHNDRYRNTG